MKNLIAAALAATVLAAPALSFAQADQAPVTRAQVKAELVQLEKPGYRPGLSSPYYPNDIQSAEAHVQGADASGYGAQPAPVVHSGAPAAAASSNARDSIFFGQ